MTEPVTIYFNSYRAIYKKVENKIYKCTALSRVEVTDENINEPIYEHGVISVYPDALLNRLTKMTGYNYLHDKYIYFMIHKGTSAMAHCFKKYGNTNEEILANISKITIWDAEPMDSRLTPEYLFGIGIPTTAGFNDIVVMAIDEDIYY